MNENNKKEKEKKEKEIKEKKVPQIDDSLILDTKYYLPKEKEINK